MRYTFRCRRCGRLTQVEHRLNEPHPSVCERPVRVPVYPEADFEMPFVDMSPIRTEQIACGGELERVFDAPNITFHGSGFYHTDKVLSDPIKPEDLDD